MATDIDNPGTRERNNEDGNASSRPNPDPTLLTTQNLLREVASLKELIEQRIKASEGLIFEKFDSVETQFDLIERQRVENKRDTQAAVEAALSAAKEAVKEQTASQEKAISKSEGATKEVLNQLATTFNTANTALLRSLDELKERIVAVDSRVGALEQQKIGAANDRTGIYSTVGIIITIAVALITVITFIIVHTGK